MGTTWTAYFADKKALVEITDYVDEGLYFEPSIKSCKILGSPKTYGLPLNVDVRVLYYWRDIINNPERGLKDWHAMKRTCSRIQRLIGRGELPEMVAPIGFPIAKDWDLLHQFSIWLWGAGGEVVSFKKVFGIFPVKRANLDSKGALETAAFLKDLTEGISLPELYLAGLEERFMDGDFGMIISGEWMIKRLQDKLGENWEEKVGVALPPAGPSGIFTFTGGSNLTIFKSVEERGNLKRALDFLSFLLNKKAQVEYAKDTGSFPALKEAMDECVVNNPSCHIFKDAIEHRRSYPSIPEWADVVEKEMTLNNLYRLWKHIIGQQELSMLNSDLKIANKVLNDKFGSSLKQIFRQLQVMLYPLLILALIILFIVIIKITMKYRKLIVTLYLKKIPQGKCEDEFLKHLLNPENVRVEIKRGTKLLKEVNIKLNEAKYENAKLFLSFIAYMTKYKKAFVSPSKIEELSRKDEEELIEEEKPLYIFSREVGVYSRPRYSQWIKDIRELFSMEEGKELLPIDPKGFRINGVIRFKKEKSGILYKLSSPNPFSHSSKNN